VLIVLDLRFKTNKTSKLISSPLKLLK